VVRSAPLTPIEEEILLIWSDVLGTEKIGVQDDFLALGGDSIQAARILARVNERFDRELQVIDIFTTSTISAMAKLIETDSARE
jgi:acyl carrier protein